MKSIVLAVALCLFADSSKAAPSKSDVQTRESQAAMTPSQALARLTEGNARFVANDAEPEGLERLGHVERVVAVERPAKRARSACERSESRPMLRQRSRMASPASCWRGS